MAESLCGGLSEEKDPEKDSSERVTRSWRKVVGTGKGVPDTEMAETLGCYDGQCGKEDRREHSGERQHLTARSRTFRAMETDSPYLCYNLVYF